MAETASQGRWKLVLYPEKGESQLFPLSKPVTTVGRDPDNDIQLDDPQISRHHFRLTQQGEKLIIEDLGTANGTQVNGGEIEGDYPLQVGDTVSLASFTFLVEGQAYPYLQSETTRRVQRVSPPPPPEPPSNQWLWPLLALLGVGLTLLVLLAFLTWRLVRPAVITSVAEVTPSSTPAAPSAPVIIVNQAPAFDSQVQTNHSLLLQAIASDPAGVTRMELWVNGQKVDQVESSLAQHVPSLTAAFEWAPESIGTYTLEIRAYNQSGQVGQTVVTTVMAVEPATPTAPLASPTPIPSPTILPLLPSETPTPIPTPTETSTPLPTATSTPAVASLVVEIPAVNVRSGPGTLYPILGQIEQNDRPEIVGQASAGQGRWWQIRFDDAPGGMGWVTGDFGFTSALNSANVPLVSPPALPTLTPPTAIPTPLPTATNTATPAPTPPPTSLPLAAIRPPDDKMLLIISNRSLEGVPARLTLSGGRSVGGGREIDPPANGQVELLLEPDSYRALWSSPARNFTRGVDFTAIPGKVMVMWIVPEDGVTQTELYDELGPGALAGTAVPMVTPATVSGPAQPAVPPGGALLIIENRSVANEFAYLTLSEGNFGGGHSLIVDAGTKHTFEIIPDLYRMTWTAPAAGGMSDNREFTARAGDIVLVWVAPEKRQVMVELLDKLPN